MVAASFVTLFFWLFVIFAGFTVLAAVGEWLDRREARRRAALLRVASRAATVEQGRVMLVDPDNGIAYVRVSMELLERLRSEWSEPVRVRLIGDDLTFRKLGQPVRGVYITDDELSEVTA